MIAPRVATDSDAQRVEGIIVSEKVSATGLVKVKLDRGDTVVRHRDRLTPLNEGARELLGKQEVLR